MILPEHVHPPKINIEPEKLWFGRCCSFSNRWFSGSMLIFRGVICAVCVYVFFFISLSLSFMHSSWFDSHLFFSRFITLFVDVLVLYFTVRYFVVQGFIHVERYVWSLEVHIYISICYIIISARNVGTFSSHIFRHWAYVGGAAVLNYFVAFSLTLHSSFVPLSAGTGDLLVEPDMFQAPQPPPNGDVLRRQHEVKILVCNLKIKLFDWCVWG